MKPVNKNHFSVTDVKLSNTEYSTDQRNDNDIKEEEEEER